jgi:kynurenine 3-monooxygenase
MPTLMDDFFKNPTSSLATFKCYPWVHDRLLLLGDASHGIVPFYGQGMNAGFEDCSVLMELMESQNESWSEILPIFQKSRKPNTDAIADMAVYNFIEMRDKVADPNFLLEKKIEARIQELIMSFRGIAEKWEKGQIDSIIHEIMKEWEG